MRNCPISHEASVTMNDVDNPMETSQNTRFVME